MYVSNFEFIFAHKSLVFSFILSHVDSRLPQHCVLTMTVLFPMHVLSTFDKDQWDEDV